MRGRRHPRLRRQTRIKPFLSDNGLSPRYSEQYTETTPEKFMQIDEYEQVH